MGCKHEGQDDTMPKDNRRDRLNWKRGKANHGRKPTCGRRRGKVWKRSAANK